MWLGRVKDEKIQDIIPNFRLVENFYAEHLNKQKNVTLQFSEITCIFRPRLIGQTNSEGIRICMSAISHPSHL